MTTINISLPSDMVAQAKKTVKSRGYASISELIRDALRKVIYPNLTVNGFTKEFEDRVLESRKEPIRKSKTWDGITPFVDFVLKSK